MFIPIWIVIILLLVIPGMLDFVVAAFAVLVGGGVVVGMMGAVLFGLLLLTGVIH